MVHDVFEKILPSMFIVRLSENYWKVQDRLLFSFSFDCLSKKIMNMEKTKNSIYSIDYYIVIIHCSGYFSLAVEFVNPMLLKDQNHQDSYVNHWLFPG